MSALSPTAAAFEGFRLIRREFRAVLVWTVMWLAVLSLAAWVVASGKQIISPARANARSVAEIAEAFGPFAAAFMALFLLVWAMTTVATYRAVLRPSERRYFFLRLGTDELRVAIMTVVAFCLVLLFGGAPAYLVYVLFTPIMQAAPALARYVEWAGILVTVCLEVWLGVRLSLIAVETFAERRFHLTAYWPLTGGRFWYLLSCYFLFFLVFSGISLVVISLDGFLFDTARERVGAGDLFRRTSVLAIAGLLAILSVSSWVLSWTVFCACQAYAFRAILGGGKAGVTPV